MSVVWILFWIIAYLTDSPLDLRKMLVGCMRPTLPRGFSRRDPVEGTDEAATTNRFRC